MSRLTKQQEGKIENLISEKILEKFSDEWMTSLIEKITTKVSVSFNEKFELQEKKINNLEKEVKNLQTEIEEIREEKENMEQYSRRNNLRIFGVQEKETENTQEIVVKLIEEKLKYKINPEEIESCHRVSTKSTNKSRPILLKLTTNKTKNDIYYKKKALKGTKITIREDLTSHRKELVKTAVEHFGSKTVWSQNGKIFIFYNNKKQLIKNTDNLLAILG